MLRATLPSSARPVYKQLVLPTGRSLVRISRRQLATTAEGTIAPKTRRPIRRFLFYTTLGTATFYVGSAFFAFNNQPYYDFFVDNVPGASSFVQFAEEHDWDVFTSDELVSAAGSTVDVLKNVTGAATRLVNNVTGAVADKTQATEKKAETKVEAAKGTTAVKVEEGKVAAAAKAQSAQTTVSEKAQAVKVAATEKAQAVKAKATEVIEHSKERVQTAAKQLVTKVEKSEENVVAVGSQTAAAVQHQLHEFSSEIQDLVDQAEHVLSGKSVDDLPKHSATSAAPPLKSGRVYDAPLPLGHEPPPGYSKPAPAKVAAPSATAPKTAPQAAPAPPPLPLVAPAVAELSASEPIIAQLAGTIDGLTSFLNANPVAADKARDIIDTAKIDLTALAGRIEKVKADERAKLEAELDSKAHEYNTKIVELEIEAQDKLDSQEEGFRKYLDEEKANFVKAYRAKLEKELETQSEIINERLKEEVIAQGIEMQRRWIREIKVRVEQERGGRLAKLEELAVGLKRLERLALDNSSYLDENLRVHALWSSIRALTHAVDASARRPFREELRVLRHFAGGRDDPVLAAAVDTLEGTDVPDVGIEPLADLASWFSTSVAPRVESVALVPDQNAGLLSHLASHLFSSFRFKRQGLVEGSDVLSVISRAEYYLNEKDLDSAARELNQLKGTPKALLADWLAAARRRLEVQQALDVIQTQATLASLLVV